MVISQTRWMVSALGLLLLLLATPALANPFTVRGVAVDATASSATEARMRAMADGQLAAARAVVERLTLPESRDALPPMTAEIARQLVGGIEVDEENVAGNRYFGAVSVSFRPQQVRGFLAQAGVPFLDSPTRPLLLVPIWNRSTVFVDNPMLEAFSRSNAPHFLTPVAVPAGDLEDVRALSLQQALNADPEALRQLAARYGASRILLVRARGSENGPVEASAQVIDLLDPTASRSLNGVSVRALRQLPDRLVVQMEDDWKRQTLVVSREEQSMELGILYSSLAEWLNIQEAIGAASLVRNARLDALASDGALMQLRHIGSFEQLTRELAERGVALQRLGDGQVYAYRLGAQPPFPESAF